MQEKETKELYKQKQVYWQMARSKYEVDCVVLSLVLKGEAAPGTEAHHSGPLHLVFIMR